MSDARNTGCGCVAVLAGVWFSIAVAGSLGLFGPRTSSPKPVTTAHLDCSYSPIEHTFWASLTVDGSNYPAVPLVVHVTGYSLGSATTGSGDRSVTGPNWNVYESGTVSQPVLPLTRVQVNVFRKGQDNGDEPSIGYAIAQCSP